jgi:hypothetical protein
MKIKNGLLEGALGAFMDVTSNRMNGALAWKLVQVKRAVADALGAVQEARDGLIKQYGEGDKIEQSSANWEPFVAAINELYAQESEISVQPLKVDELLGLEFKPDSLGLLNAVGLVEG